jgi:hypothetical protein
MAWSKDAWCVLSVIKFEEQFEPYVALSIHPSKTEAQSLILRLSESERWSTTVRLIKYNRHIRDLKEGDIICGYKLDVVVNYYERERNSDVIREVIREAH